MILGVYKNSLGVAFKGKSSANLVSTIESCVRENFCNSYYFLLFFNKIFPLLPVDVCTLTDPYLMFLCLVVINPYCLLVIDHFHASVVEPTRYFSLTVSGVFTTIGIIALASKTTTTTKLEVEIFDGKSNFLLWKMQVTVLLVKDDIYKALLGAEKKPSKMEDDEWNIIDLRAKAMITLCLSDEVLYNIMNEETTARL